MPALQASRIDLTSAMKSSTVGVIGGRRSFLRSGLVLIQVSLSFLLLVGAGLMLKSLREMQKVSPGFSTSDVLTTWIDLRSAGYDLQRKRDFETELIDRLQALPGIESAVFSRVTPFSYRAYSSGTVNVDEYVPAPDEDPTVEFNEVGPGYLSTLGMPLIAGREFSRDDNETAPPVAIVNDVMAQKYWRDGNAVGKRLQLDKRWLEVVGIAKNSKHRSLIEPAETFFYVPMRQSELGIGLQVRTSLAPGDFAVQLRKEVRSLDANLVPGEVITMGEQVVRMNWTQRTSVVLLGAFSAVALSLATIGLYGVMAYAVSQSTRELGLRIALGARSIDLVRLVAARGLRLTFAGILFGALISLSLTQLMSDLLYKVSARDPLTFGLALIVMMLAATAACLLPAVRATRIDPVRSLKE